MTEGSKASLRALLLGFAAFLFYSAIARLSEALQHLYRHFPAANLSPFVLLAAVLTLSIWFGRSSGRRAWAHGSLAGLGLSVPLLLVALHSLSPDPRTWIWLLGRPMMWLYVFLALSLAITSLWSGSAALWFGHRRLIATLVAAGSVGLAVAIFAAGFGFMRYYDARAQAVRDFTAQHPVDMPLPRLALTTLDGTPISASALQGHITVMHFWATWCAECVAEFPSLEAAYKEYSGNPRVQFLLVNPEIEGDTPEKVDRFLESRPIPIPVALDPGPSYFDLSNQLHNNGLPLLIVVDQRGHIRFCEYGFEGTDKTRLEIGSEINALLVAH